jgi:glucose-1-phosphate adenylyltransferase
LPKLIGNARVFAHALRAGDASAAPYWRDIGTLQTYWRAHMDLLGPAPLVSLNDVVWPIRGAAVAPRTISTPLSTARGGKIQDSIVGAGCSVAGQLLHSVSFGDTEIGRGATVVDSVVLPGARIGAGSRLRGVIVGEGHRVPEGIVLERSASAAEPPVLADARECREPARYAAGR